MLASSIIVTKNYKFIELTMWQTSAIVYFLLQKVKNKIKYFEVYYNDCVHSLQLHIELTWLYFPGKRSRPMRNQLAQTLPVNDDRPN